MTKEDDTDIFDNVCKLMLLCKEPAVIQFSVFSSEQKDI